MNMRYFFIFITFLMLPFVNSTLSGQREVAILKTDHQNRLVVHPNITSSGLSFPFMLDRNQIWLEASIEDQRGYFILDTGSPTLLLNSR